MYNFPKLIESAYDLSSGGIGVERALVQALIGERKFNDFLEKEREMGVKSNLLNHVITLAVFYPEKWPDSEYKSHFGDRGPEFRARYSDLRRQNSAIERILLRSAIRGELVENADDFSPVEFKDLMYTLFQGTVKLGDQGLDALYKTRASDMEFVGALYERGLPSVKIHAFIDAWKSYLKSPELAAPILRLRTGKLELMADVFHVDLVKSGADLEIRPDTLDSKWAHNWKTLFSEEMPTAHKLVIDAKGTVSRARAHYQKNLEKKDVW